MLSFSGERKGGKAGSLAFRLAVVFSFRGQNKNERRGRLLGNKKEGENQNVLALFSFWQ